MNEKDNRSTDLTVVELSSVLSQDQRGDLNHILSEYVKKNKFKNYENIKSAGLVVARCVEDGLNESVGRSVPLPEDDLNRAFEIGMSLRERRVGRVKRVLVEQDEAGVNYLALSNSISSEARREIDSFETTPDLLAVRKVDDLASLRSSLFHKLSDQIYGEVQKNDPEIKESDLPLDQRFLLLNNMVFSQVLGVDLGSIPLVQEVILNKDKFLTEFAKIKKSETNLDKSVFDFNLEGMKEYFVDLGNNIALTLDSIPVVLDGVDDIERFEGFGEAVRRIKKTFLVMNPLDELQSRFAGSEPNKVDVWKLGKPVEFIFENQGYEIPSETSLRFGSVLASNNLMAQEANLLRNFSRMIDVFGKNYLLRFGDLDQLKLQFLEYKNQYDGYSSMLLEQQFPEELLFKEEEIVELRNGYGRQLRDKCELFESLKKWRGSFLKTSVSLFKKYETGVEAMSPDDKKKALICLLGERVLSREVDSFVKEIWQEKGIDNNLLEISSFFDYYLADNALKKGFSLFDLLKMRDKLSLNRYRWSRDGLQDDEIRQSWSEVSQIRREDILARIRNEIVNRQHPRAIEETDIKEFLQNKFNPLSKDYRELSELDLSIDKNVDKRHREITGNIFDNFFEKFDHLVAKRLKHLGKVHSFSMKDELDSIGNALNNSPANNYFKQQERRLNEEDTRVVLSGIILRLCPKFVLKDNIASLPPKKGRELVVSGLKNFLENQGINNSEIDFQSHEFADEINSAIKMLERYKSLAERGETFFEKWSELTSNLETYESKNDLVITKSDPLNFMSELEKRKKISESKLNRQIDLFKDYLEKLRANGLLRVVI